MPVDRDQSLRPAGRYPAAKLRERIALRVAAENVAGVKAVRDHIVWVEPTSGLVIPAPDADAA